nr:hypothetical protein [Tanacetum cinerariifolium]
MAPKITTRSSPVTTTTTTTPVTNAQLKALTDQGVDDALAARVFKLTQWFERIEIVFCINNCTMENQIKIATCTLLGSALTRWNSHIKTVGHDVAYAMTWINLKKNMTDKMFPEESDKIERYVDGLPNMIHRSVMSSKPKTMQDAVEFTTELMDNKIYTFV